MITGQEAFTHDTVSSLRSGQLGAADYLVKGNVLEDDLLKAIEQAVEWQGKQNFQQKMPMRLAEAFGRAVDAKEKYTREHSRNVTRIALALAKALIDEGRVNAEQLTLHTVELSGLLHDIGKLGIYNAILHKPDRLTNPEYEIVRLIPPLEDRL